VTLGFGLRFPHLGQAVAPGATGEYQQYEQFSIATGFTS
jgi:hypothetical protein